MQHQMVPEGFFVWAAGGRVLKKTSQCHRLSNSGVSPKRLAALDSELSPVFYQFIFNPLIRHVSLSHVNHHLPSPIISYLASTLFGKWIHSNSGLANGLKFFCILYSSLKAEISAFLLIRSHRFIVHIQPRTSCYLGPFS